jgi:hypothetical protein
MRRRQPLEAAREAMTIERGIVDLGHAFELRSEALEQVRAAPFAAAP